ncbi:MAG TPA: DUF3667 domain-containing protein [Gemmatimonadaceae bacterium]|jgi:hypothetical protein|nr:DUF3667 domain-containing protein [Gemmatimonadaceae bacterium]
MPTSTITERSPTYVAASTAAWSTECLNCHAALNGPFCSQCGQRAVPPHPGVRDLAGEAFSEFTGWDGKFVETFKLLLTNPGAVTRQFIEGRRVRFISPVRLYLTMSVVYFLIAASAPNLNPVGFDVVGGIRFGVSVSDTSGLGTAGTAGSSKPTGPAIASRASATAMRNGKVDAALRDSARKQLVRAPRWVKPILERSIEDPQGLKHNILENMPRVLFALLPVFALILDVFYRRYRYPAHLYFSIHFHTLVFLLLALSEAAKFTHLPPVAKTTAAIVQLAIPVYFVAALRGMYGGSILRTLAKGFGIAVLYVAVSGCAIYALAFYAAIAR